MIGQRINIEMVSTDVQEVVEVNFCYFEFHKNFIEHAFEFKQRPLSEEAELQEEGWLFQKSIILRQHIAAVDLQFAYTARRWRVIIAVAGADDYLQFFKSKESGAVLYNAVKNWLDT